MKQLYNFEEIGEILGISRSAAMKLWEEQGLKILTAGKFKCGRLTDIEAVLGSKLPDDTKPEAKSEPKPGVKPEAKRIEDKVTLVTIEEERKVIIDDANKEAERIIAEAVERATSKAREDAEAILEEAQEALDRAEQVKEDISKRERALHNRETELDDFEDSLGEREAKLTKRVREEDLLLLDNKERWQANKQSEINRAITEHCLTCIQGKYVYNHKNKAGKFTITV